MVESGLAAAAFLGAVAVPAWAQDVAESAVQVTVHEPLSPYARVVWELKRVGGTPAVAVTREHAGGYGTESEVEIVSEAVFAVLLATAAPCFEVVDDPDAERALDHWWASGRAVAGEREVQWLASGDGIDGPAARCVDALRSPILEIVEVEPYAMPFWDEGEYGTLRATSSMPAHLWVDGRPMGLVTPVNALRLAPGVHEVRWVSVAGGREQVRQVTVVEGATTAVDVRF